jgi:hypothetical protein
LKGILHANQRFQGKERVILLQIGLFSRVDKTHVSLKRKPSMLQAAAFSTWFVCENCVSFSKEYFWQIIVFKVEKGSFNSKWAYPAKLKKHMYLSKQHHLFRSRSIYHIDSLCDLIFERNTSYQLELLR